MTIFDQHGDFLAKIFCDFFCPGRKLKLIKFLWKFRSFRPENFKISAHVRFALKILLGITGIQALGFEYQERRKKKVGI